MWGIVIVVWSCTTKWGKASHIGWSMELKCMCAILPFVCTILKSIEVLTVSFFWWLLRIYDLNCLTITITMVHMALLNTFMKLGSFTAKIRTRFTFANLAYGSRNMLLWCKHLSHKFHSSMLLCTTDLLQIWVSCQLPRHYLGSTLVITISLIVCY